LKNTKKATSAIICLSPYSGGMEIDAIKLAKKLSDYTKVIMIAKSGCFIDTKRDDYVGFNDIKLETISFRSSLSLNIILNVRKIIKEYGIENVIFFGASELKSLYFSFLGLDINLIVRHGTTKSRPKKDWFHRLIYSNVNYHVSICKHLENNVKYIIPFGKNTQSKLIYSSFNFDEPKQMEHNKLTLLHVGRIASGKGQIDAIQACDVLVKNGIDFEFNIVGGFDASYEKRFLEFYENCSYKDKINLVGFTDNVRSYLEIADIFIFPSHGEGLSNAFMEAISNDIVCIAYENTSFPELRDLGFYFEMCKNKNIEDLQKTLLETILNLENKKNSAKINHTLVRELFSLQNELNQYKKILK
jgi:glycosyltransferase involved in cell wall biosynthesis